MNAKQRRVWLRARNRVVTEFAQNCFYGVSDPVKIPRQFRASEKFWLDAQSAMQAVHYLDSTGRDAPAWVPIPRGWDPA